MITGYANYEWFIEQDLSEYSGKWIAIIDKKIIAISQNIHDLIIKVKENYPNRKPFITKVNSRQSIL